MVAETRVRVGEFDYVIGAIPLNRAMHVARKLMGLIGSGAGVVNAATNTDERSFDVSKIADMIVNMNDAQADAITYDFLRVVRRSTDMGMIPVMSSVGNFAIADLQIDEAFQLIIESAKFNFESFIKRLQSNPQLAKQISG